MFNGADDVQFVIAVAVVYHTISRVPRLAGVLGNGWISLCEACGYRIALE